MNFTQFSFGPHAKQPRGMSAQEIMVSLATKITTHDGQRTNLKFPSPCHPPVALHLTSLAPASPLLPLRLSFPSQYLQVTETFPHSHGSSPIPSRLTTFRRARLTTFRRALNPSPHPRSNHFPTHFMTLTFQVISFNSVMTIPQRHWPGAAKATSF